MSHARTRTVVSLLTVLLFSLHWADDVVRGFAPGGLSAVWGLLIVLVWLYATLVLAERRAGLVLIFLGSILGSGVPILHMSGAGLVGGRIAHTSGVFFWVWTLLALGVCSMLSLVLSGQALWRLRRGAPS